MRKISVWGLLAAVVLAIGCSPLNAYAQGSASLVGKVLDASGGVMPGVTVTATSPALQVPEKTVVTETDGTYRIVQLPVGVYTVKFELQGFQTYVQTDIRLTVSFAGRVDAIMKVGTVSESITVSGHSPVIDTVNTTSSTTFQQEALQSTPKGQGMWQIYGLASGVKISGAPDVGDSEIGSRGS
ncbi:MAG: carboxypeptidase-like regulatory domain-containing protein, partial [Vicinamibacterales bacterium]